MGFFDDFFDFIGGFVQEAAAPIAAATVAYFSGGASLLAEGAGAAAGIDLAAAASADAVAGAGILEAASAANAASIAASADWVAGSGILEAAQASNALSTVATASEIMGPPLSAAPWNVQINESIFKPLSGAYRTVDSTLGAVNTAVGASNILTGNSRGSQNVMPLYMGNASLDRQPKPYYTSNSGNIIAQNKSVSEATSGEGAENQGIDLPGSSDGSGGNVKTASEILGVNLGIWASVITLVVLGYQVFGSKK